jgi:hypothetical protein
MNQGQIAPCSKSGQKGLVYEKIGVMKRRLVDPRHETRTKFSLVLEDEDEGGGSLQKEVLAQKIALVT